MKLFAYKFFKRAYGPIGYSSYPKNWMPVYLFMSDKSHDEYKNLPESKARIIKEEYARYHEMAIKR